MPVQKNKWSLRLTVLLFVCMSLTIFTIIFFSIFHSTMPKMLLQSEEKYLEEQITIVSGLLEEENDYAFCIADDIAVWDETVGYILGENPNFITKFWPETSLLDSYSFNFIVFKDAGGTNIYSAFSDYQNSEQMAVPWGFSKALNPIAERVLAMHETPIDFDGDITKLGVGGYMFHDGVPYYVVAMPIMSTREKGEPVGTLLLGNILTDEYFQNLTHLESVQFSVTQTGDGEKESQINRTDDTVSTVMPFTDLNGNDIELTMTAERVIYTEGQNRINSTTILLVAAIIIFMVVLYHIIKRLVLRPIEKLSNDIEDIEEDITVHAAQYSDTQEFEKLCGSINSMVEHLNQSRVSLDVLQRILNGVDAYLYVTDPETDQILFMNDRMAIHFGIEGDPVGQRCWEVMQRQDTQKCPDCPKKRLLKNPDGIEVWEEKSEVTGRYYRNTDCMINWAGDQLAHLQYRVDITDAKGAEVALQNRLKQQELMSAMSQSFISTDDMPTLINNALDMTGRFMDAGKIVISRVNYETDQLDFAYGWTNEEQGIDIMPVRGMPFQAGNFWHDAFATGQESYIAEDDIRESEKYQSMANFQINSFLSVPIYIEGKLWGVITIDICVGTRKWSESDIHLVKLISNVISGVIYRDEMEEDLNRMSSIVNSSPQFISYIDKDANFIYINPGTERTLSYAFDDLYGKSIDEVLGAQDRLRKKRDFKQIIAITNQTIGGFQAPIA